MRPLSKRERGKRSRKVKDGLEWFIVRGFCSMLLLSIYRYPAEGC